MTKQAWTISALLGGEAFAWLDALAEPLQNGAHAVFRAGKIGQTAKNWLNGVPLRHRFHPAIIIIPIGAWTTALLLDALDLFGDDQRASYRASADAAIVFGLVGTLPAMAAGFADWVDTYSQPRRIGMAHAALNIAATALYAASLGLRWNDQRRAGQVLAALGYSLTGLGAAFGGELVYTLGVNIPHLLYPKPPNKELDVLASDALPERTAVIVRVGAGAVPVLLYRERGEVLAVEGWCPHAGGPLAEGDFVDGTVRCPWHGARFCLRDGAPLDGPATVPLRTFIAREQNGRISVEPSYLAQDWPPPPDEE